MEKLTERLQVRITPSLWAALHTKARILRLRVADVARMALAQALVDVGQAPDEDLKGASQANDV